MCVHSKKQSILSSIFIYIGVSTTAGGGGGSDDDELMHATTTTRYNRTRRKKIVGCARVEIVERRNDFIHSIVTFRALFQRLNRNGNIKAR